MDSPVSPVKCCNHNTCAHTEFGARSPPIRKRAKINSLFSRYWEETETKEKTCTDTKNRHVLSSYSLWPHLKIFVQNLRNTWMFLRSFSFCDCWVWIRSMYEKSTADFNDWLSYFFAALSKNGPCWINHLFSFFVSRQCVPVAVLDNSPVSHNVYGESLKKPVMKAQSCTELIFLAVTFSFTWHSPA